ncbi:MAG: arginase [Candidatus Berkiella sp.]
MQRKSFDIIGAELGWGAKNHLTQEGSVALKALGIEKTLQQINPQLAWYKSISAAKNCTPGLTLNYTERLQQVHEFTNRLADEVQQSINDHHCPLIIGGDHSMAVGTWSGAVEALQAHESFGLIWIDAHMDSHTPQTTPSQNIHGMPLAALMGYGESALTHLKGKSPKLNPRHVVLIGVRSFEEGEAALLKNLNVSVYYMDDIKKMGIKTVFEKALLQVTQNTKAFGVSVDIDAFDPSIAPGTGAPVPDGLFAQDVLPAIHRLSHHPKFCALEIAELNPSLDIGNKTLILSQQILEEVVKDV